MMHIEKPNDKVIEKIKNKLKKWDEWLAIDGSNTKAMVRNDIQHLLKELEE